MYDQLGHHINLPGIPQRIISLVPSQTELLFDLGLDAHIVGVTKFCVHPQKRTATNYTFEKYRDKKGRCGSQWEPHRPWKLTLKY